MEGVGRGPKKLIHQLSGNRPRGGRLSNIKSRAMQRQELIALLKANSDRQCKDLELEQEAKDEIKKLMGWNRFVPNTFCSTVLTKLGVSGDDAKEVGVEEDSDDTGYTMSPSADEVISFLEQNTDIEKYHGLPPNIKEGYRKALGLTKVGNATNCTTLLKNLDAKFGRGTERGDSTYTTYSPRIPSTLSWSGGGGGGIDSPVSLSPADDAGDTMSEVSLSRSEGNSHQTSPQTRGFLGLGSLFSRGQAENSHDDHQDPPPAVAEPEPVQEPVMVKSDVLRIILWFKAYIGKLKDENRGLMDTMTSMEEQIRNLEKLPKNQPYQFLNVEEFMMDHTRDL